MNTVKIQIFSMVAAAAGKDKVVWSGEIPESYFEGNLSGEDGINGMIFRIFNRVSETDVDFLNSIKYDLPSLSIGDFLTWQFGSEPSKTFQIKAVGFDQITSMRNLI
jgi:hypothetical protein